MFAVDANGEAALPEGKAVWLRTGYTAPRRLDIVYAEHARVFHREAAAAGVAITFRTSEPFSLPPVP